jgi:tight adherence protein B
MLLAGIAFALTFGVIVGAHWIFDVRPERAARRRLLNRLGGVAADSVEPIVLVKAAAATYAGATWLDRVRRRVAGALRAVGVQDTSRFLSRTGGAALVVMALALGAGASSLTALVLALSTAATPLAWMARRRQQRLNALEEMFPQAIDLLVRALRAGHAFSSAAAMVAEELPDPIAAEFRMIHEQQNFGMAVPDVLREFADRVPLPDVRFFVTAVLTQRETGGNLSHVLENLATVTRDRFRVRRQLRVMTAQGRMTGWALGTLPMVLAVFLLFWAPSHAVLLLHDPLGQKMLMAAGALQITGIFVIRRIVQVEY